MLVYVVAFWKFGSFTESISWYVLYVFWTLRISASPIFFFVSFCLTCEASEYILKVEPRCWIWKRYIVVEQVTLFIMLK